MTHPFIYLSGFLVVGIFLTQFVAIPLLLPFLLSSIFVLAALITAKFSRLSHVAIYLAILFLGMARYQASTILPSDHIAAFAGDTPKKVFLMGIVVDDPMERSLSYGDKKFSFLLDARQVKEDTGWKSARGLVKVNSYKKGMRFEYGDEIVLEGSLSKPVGLNNPGLFNYAKHLRSRGIHAMFKVGDNSFTQLLGNTSRNSFVRLAYRMRHNIRRAIDAYFEEPDKGFLKALIIGDRGDVGRALNDDFINTGTVHILSISGQHVAIMAAILFFLLKVFAVKKRPSILITLLFMVFYSFVAGSSPPIIRSVIMFTIFSFGYLLDRESDILNSLGLAAFLMLLWRPSDLFEPAFQLSFLSLASIVVYSPWIDGILGVKESSKDGRLLARIGRYALKSISISMAAWLGTWPVVAFYFNIISPVSVIANLVIIPFIFIIMAGAFIFLLVSLISTLAGNTISIIMSLIIQALFYLNHLLSIIPFSHFRIPAPSILFFVIYYLILSLMTVWGRKIMRAVKRFGSRTIIAGLLTLNIIVWLWVLTPEKDLLKITFFDVGQGDSALIELPYGGVILLDGGSGGDEEGWDMGRMVIAPYLWNKCIKKIDLIVVSHFHEDHMGGLVYILQNFKVGRIMDNGAGMSDNALCKKYENLIREKNLKHAELRAGDEIDFSDGVKVYVLNPKDGDGLIDSNDASLVLKIVYKNSSVMLCGDVTSKVMEPLISQKDFLKSDILKVPHHGGGVGDILVAQNFFASVKPDFSIISVGRINRYNAPSKKILDAITSLDSISYETREDGAIVLVSDGYGWRREDNGKN